MFFKLSRLSWIVFVLFVLDVSAFAGNFTIPVTVSDGSHSVILEFGINVNGTDDYDAGLDQYYPPKPPGGFDGRISKEGEGYRKDIRKDDITGKTFVLEYQPSENGNILLTWNSSALSTLGKFTITDDITGELYTLDMTSTDRLEVTSSPYIIDKLRITYTRDGTGLNANDHLAEAILITTVPFSVDQSLIGATRETNERDGSCYVSDNSSVWFQYTPPANGTLNIETCGSNFDTTLTVWTGAGHPLTQVGCNDDDTSAGGAGLCGGGLVSSLSVEVTSGTTYSIRVAEYGSSAPTSMNLDFDLDFAPDAEPAYLLWTHTDGEAALWPLNVSGNPINARSYGPFAGWTAHHYHHTSDGTAHVLWTHSDGTAALWTLNASGAVVRTRSYGPYAGWTARHYHCTSDGTTRLLWTHSDGRAALWTLNASGTVVGARTYGPYAGWTLRHYHHTSDGTTRLLWTHTDGTVALWTLNASGTVIRAWTYGPYAGWTVRHYHHTSDGTVQLLWTHTDGRAALWTLNASGTFVKARTYGPYAGWTARHSHPNSDGTAHVLWTHTDRRAALWTLNASGDVVRAWTYGPYAGWTAVECHHAVSALPASLLGHAGNAVIIKKAGSGTGTIIADDRECGLGCVELSVPYVEHGTVTLQVIPDARSTFVRWETADGRPIAGLHYAQPGDTVIAVFEETP